MKDAAKTFSFPLKGTAESLIVDAIMEMPSASYAPSTASRLSGIA
jgi:hypothetical protein